jgi:hypothetical protein
VNLKVLKNGLIDWGINDRFIDGDVSSYTCSDVNYITSLEE